MDWMTVALFLSKAFLVSMCTILVCVWWKERRQHGLLLDLVTAVAVVATVTHAILWVTTG